MSQLMHKFRKHQKVIMAVTGVLIIFTFTVGGIISQYQEERPDTRGVKASVVTYKGGRISEQEMQLMVGAHHRAAVGCAAVGSAGLSKGQMPQGYMVYPFFGERSIWGIPPSADEDTVLQIRLLAEKGRQLGMDVDNTTVTQFLYRLYGVPSTSTSHDRDIQDVLRRELGDNMSVQQFYEQMKIELLAQHVRYLGDTVLTARNMQTFETTPPPAEAYTYFERLNRQSEVESMPVKVADFVDQVKGKPTERELNDLFAKHKLQFTNPYLAEPGFKVPPKVAVQYVKVDFNKLLEAEKTKITEEQIKAEYERGAAAGEFNEPQLPALNSDKKKLDDPKTDEPKTDEPKTDEPKTDEPKTDEPKTDEPKTDEPKTDEPKTDEPKTDEPKTDEPKTDEPKTDEPKTDEPKTDEPKTDEPKADEPKADESKPDDFKSDEKATEPRPEGSFGQDVIPPADQPADETKSEDRPAEDKPADDKPGEEKPATPESKEGDKPAEEKPAADKPADDKPADDKPADDKPAADKPDTEKPTTEAPAGAKPKVKPLEKVREEIINTLATRPAQQELTKKFEAMDKLVKEYANKTREERRLAHEEQDKKKRATLKEDVTPFNLAAEAKKLGLEFGEVPLTGPYELEEFEIGRAFGRVRNRMLSFPQIVFQANVNHYEPEAVRSFSTEFLFWVTDEEEEYVPTFEQARAEVEKAWKFNEARKLAQEEAEREAQNVKKDQTLKDVFGEKVTASGKFSWLRGPNMPMGMGGEPTLSEVNGVEQAGDEFMRTVFGLKVGETGVAVNESKSIYYVVRVTSRTPDEENLREQFVGSRAALQSAASVARQERGQLGQQWLADLQKEFKVEWQRPPRQPNRG
jgi:hypothetical protein